MKKNHRRGFTLVELVVVVAIVAILAMVAAPRFMGLTDGSKVSTLESNHDVIKTAVTMYMSDHGGAMPSGTNSSEVMDKLQPYIANVEAGNGNVNTYFNGTSSATARPANSSYSLVFTAATGSDPDKLTLTSTVGGLTGANEKFTGREGTPTNDTGYKIEFSW